MRLRRVAEPLGSLKGPLFALRDGTSPQMRHLCSTPSGGGRHRDRLRHHPSSRRTLRRAPRCLHSPGVQRKPKSCKRQGSTMKAVLCRAKPPPQTTKCLQVVRTDHRGNRRRGGIHEEMKSLSAASRTLRGGQAASFPRVPCRSPGATLLSPLPGLIEKDGLCGWIWLVAHPEEMALVEDGARK